MAMTFRGLWARVLLAVCLGTAAAGIAPAQNPPTPGAKIDDRPLDDKSAADLVERAVGKRPVVVCSERFRMITLADPTEARKLLALGERIHADFARFLGEDPKRRYWPGTADTFIVLTREHYLAVLRNVFPRYGIPKRVIDFWGSQPNWAHSCVPPLTVWAAPEGATGSNQVASAAGRDLIVHATGMTKPPWSSWPLWLQWGFGMHTEHEYVGSIRMIVHVDKMYGPQRRRHGPWADTATWSGKLAEDARGGNHASLFSFAEIKRRKYINEWDDRYQAETWSLVRFLVKAHPQKFARCLKLMRKQPFDTAFAQTFGWTDAQVHTKWTAWVAAGLGGLVKVPPPR